MLLLLFLIRAVTGGGKETFRRLRGCRLPRKRGQCQGNLKLVLARVMGIGREGSCHGDGSFAFFAWGECERGAGELTARGRRAAVSKGVTGGAVVSDESLPSLSPLSGPSTPRKRSGASRKPAVPSKIVVVGKGG